MATKTKKKSKRGAALITPMKASEELQDIVKEKKISRGQAMKQVWKYIKRKDLQDPDNTRMIVPDKKLAQIVGKKPISMFKLGGKIFKHLS